MSTFKEQYRAAAHRVKTARHHFELFGVHRQIATSEVIEARNALLRVLHPDRLNAEGVRDEGLAAVVTAAATEIADTKARTKYLAKLATGRGKCPACQGTGTKRVQKSIKNIYFTACATCGGAGMV